MTHWLKLLLAFITLLLGMRDLLIAQPAIQKTAWKGQKKNQSVAYRFYGDTLESVSDWIYQQEGDTISLYVLGANQPPHDAVAKYLLRFLHQGQLMATEEIGKGVTGDILPFANGDTLEFIPANGEARRDWLALDPALDSVAGISLYRARSLLQNRHAAPVVVAVIDNGVDINHPILKKNIWTNSREIPGNGKDDDHNGYVDDVHGWNFRGRTDGSIVQNEQASSTHLYESWKNEFSHLDTNNLDVVGSARWTIFKRARLDYQSHASSSDSSERLYVYNPEYQSDDLIQHGSSDIHERGYGSPDIILSPWLSHGTHVAGIIREIDEHAVIMPVVASTATGDERDRDVANAIRYAVDNGAKIVNISFSKLFSAEKFLVDDAIRYAEQKDVLIIHSAGNDGVDIDSPSNNHYPIAVYDDGTSAKNFVSVGWNRSLFNARLAHPYSNYGNHTVDLFAPGSDIYSTVPGGGYDFKSGSSMSAPVVSGVASLLRSYFPELSAVQIKSILMRSAFKPKQTVNRPGAKEPVSFQNLSVSGGIVNAYYALVLAAKEAGHSK